MNEIEIAIQRLQEKLDAIDRRNKVGHFKGDTSSVNSISTGFSGNLDWEKEARVIESQIAILKSMRDGCFDIVDFLCDGGNMFTTLRRIK